MACPLILSVLHVTWTIDSRVEGQNWISPVLIFSMLRCNTTAPVQIISLKWSFEKLLLVTCSPTKACFAVLHKKGWISPVLHCLWRLVFSFVQSNNA